MQFTPACDRGGHTFEAAEFGAVRLEPLAALQEGVQHLVHDH